MAEDDLPQKQQPEPEFKPEPEQEEEEEEEEEEMKLLKSYIGISFSLFIASLPTRSITLIPTLHSEIRDVSSLLHDAEDQLRQMSNRRKEDSKANARVVEIFASHRNGWQAEERRLQRQIDDSGVEIAELRAKVEDLEREKSEFEARIRDLEREVGERDEMIGLFSRSVGVGVGGGGDEEESELGRFRIGVDNRFENDDERSASFGSDLFGSASSRLWSGRRSSLWQEVQHDSLESLYDVKHFVARREHPWKVAGEQTGVSSKLKLLEQELQNLEMVGKMDLSPAVMRKQTKRYQSLAAKIDDLCKRMQASDPCETALSAQFRIQRQTEYLLEAFRLQQRASETGRKLTVLQIEIGKSYHEGELGSDANFKMRRLFECIKSNLREVQRNLEIWLARIIGDLEGILTRDGSSHTMEYYIPRYPFVQ